MSEIKSPVGKIVKDKLTGDVGKVMTYCSGYYLIKWLSTEIESHHHNYAKYTEDGLIKSKRFEFLEGADALVYLI